MTTATALQGNTGRERLTACVPVADMIPARRRIAVLNAERFSRRKINSQAA